MIATEPRDAAVPAALAARIAARRRELDGSLDALFDAAWAGVRELAQPFKYELDLLRQPAGRWHALLADAPLRAVDLPLLLLEDLGASPGPDRDAVERALTESTALTVAAVLASELVIGGEASYGIEHTLLVSGLVAAAGARLAAATREPGRLGAMAVAHWAEANDGLLSLRSARIGRALPYGPRDLRTLGRRWAPLKTPLAYATAHAGAEALLPRLLPLVDEAAALWQLTRDLAAVSRDLSRGRFTVPIARLWRAFGGPLPLERPVDPDGVLLAGAITRALPDLAEEATARHQALLQSVDELGLPHLRRGLVPLGEPFAAVRAAYALGDAVPTSGGEAPFVVSHRPQLGIVLAAAEGYLKADPTYHEAWEINRWDFLNVSELACRVFPTGLILENRIAAGEDCGAELDALFTRYADNWFHYYEQPSSLPPDCDTLGLMLRLADRAADPARARALLETPLSWLPANVAADGSLPVFLTRGVVADGRRHVTVAAQGCAAVRAGLLLGLLTFDPARFAALIARAAAPLLEEVALAGGFSLWFYDVPYGAGVLLALTGALVRGGLAAPSALAAAEARCLSLLEAQRGLGRVSCQDAALLWMATQAAPARPLRDREWIEILLRGQHHDGGWDAAPLYTIPNRGNVMNWYASRLVTTSYAYRALKDHLREAT